MFQISQWSGDTCIFDNIVYIPDFTPEMHELD